MDVKLAAVEQRLGAVEGKAGSAAEKLAAEVDRLAAATAELRDGQTRTLGVLRALYEGTEQKRQDLAKLRVSKEYEGLFRAREPLVSVRIATYNNAQMLGERALESVLRQTYEHYEVIVVGDGCDDDTEGVIKKLNSDKIRFYNLPERGRYPEDARARWMVAGTAPMNAGADLAQGAWIAPLDDDDEFTEDHIEVLLAGCLSSHAELSYGRFRWRSEGEEKVLGVYPPQLGNFGFQAAVYASVLRPLFRYDVNAWIFDEPGDWNLCRRMYEAGVRMQFVDRIVATVFHYARAGRKAVGSG